jgi:hypothetical protein
MRFSKVPSSSQHVRITATTNRLPPPTSTCGHELTFHELGDGTLLQSDSGGAIAQEIRAKVSTNAQPLPAQVSCGSEEQDRIFADAIT